MKRNVQLLTALVLTCATAAAQQQAGNDSPRRISLHEAVQLALSHNHAVRIANYKADEKMHTKEVARSAYFPSIRNDSHFMHLTDTQLIEIPTGSLGVVSGTPVPTQSSIVNQGGRNLMTSGTSGTARSTQ